MSEKKLWIKKRKLLFVIFLIVNFFFCSQAVVNSRDEERERLRLELKAAQDELNMLREIQRRVSGSNVTGLAPTQGRPQSFISDASSYSDTEAVANAEEDEMQGKNMSPNVSRWVAEVWSNQCT